MATLVIKNLPEPLHAQLKERALRNHRSLNKEAVALIEATLAAAPPDKSATDTNPLDALFAAGDHLAASGVDFDAWVANSRKVWR